MESRKLIEATCPECRGPLTEVQDSEIVEFHCLVGHRYAPESLLRAHYETQERALWGAVVALEESLKMVQAVIPHLSPERSHDLQSVAEEKFRQAKRVREILVNLNAYPLQQP